jgi:hypothetical protein
MSALHLSYDVETDRLAAQIGRTSSTGAVEVTLDKVTFLIDPAHKLVASFKISDFSHFVSYHLLGELFGDEAIRKIAAFQSSAVAQRQARQDTIELKRQPASGRRVIGELLKAA